jgi:tetratricopeptide (TPR) repeat protein
MTMARLAMRRVLAAGCLVLALESASAQTQAPLVEMIAGYADWAAGRRKTADVDVVDLDAARRELGRMDPSDIPVDPAWTPEQVREMRRRVLTSFALELAVIGARRHASSAGQLVEWACAYVRSHTPLNDFDRAWQLAALAVVEGGIDSRALADHVSHAQPVFRDEPRLLLARGIVEEQFNAPSEALVRTETAANLQRAREALARAEGESFRASERAIARFQEAAHDESVAAEASLRAGHVQMKLARYDAALATLTGIERKTKDPALLYLLHLFRGIAYEGRGRFDEARQSYKAALGISPRAHSATLRLAALAFRYGHDDDPAAMTDALLKDNDPRRDPWWSYYAADWRFWYARIERVRTFLRTP